MPSKKDQCMTIALEHQKASRQELIELFVTKVGMSYPGASTYENTIRKELGLKHEILTVQAHIEEAREQESDIEIAIRLKERFDVINMLTVASTEGKIRSLIVSGPAGLGKSYTIMQAVRNYDPSGERTVIAKGVVRPTGLYLLLHDNRNKGDVIVLDDADSVFNDGDALNILKAACDSTHERRIDWRAETKMVDENGEPVERSFVYEGTLIFITNIDFHVESKKGGKNADHFEALISRSHYVDCDMHYIREYLVRIKQVVEEDGMLRDQKGLTAEEEQQVVQFIFDHPKDLHDLTLRMALKLADLFKIATSYEHFESLAKVSCFKNRAILTA